MIQINTPYVYKIYVSFSGGKDSTVLLHLVRNIYPDCPAVFVDTGLEYPEVRSFVKSHDNITILKPDMSFRKVIETYGYPIVSKPVAKRVQEYRRAQIKGRVEQTNAYKEFNGLLLRSDGEPSMFNKEKWRFLLDADFLISDHCCSVMKKNPSMKYARETGRHPIIGTMACESLVRKQAWKNSGCNSFDRKQPQSQPLSFWTEQDILLYLKNEHIPYASVYGDIVYNEDGSLRTTGVQRTGCVFCGFGCHLEKEPNRFQQLRLTHPKLYEYCMRDWDSGGLGLQHVLDYINVPTE